MKKFLFIFLILLVVAGVAAKFILFDYVYSKGKRVGNLTKISQKGKVIKTWEGTLDEGFGEQLTFHFSVKDNKVAKELFSLENKKVVLFYNEHLMGWPRETKYDITEWKQQDEKPVVDVKANQEAQQKALDRAEKTLFCSFLGTLASDADLYKKVKAHVEKSNLFLFNKYDICNQKD